MCSTALTLTRLGCQSCGTELSGAFRRCTYCGLADDDLEMLRVFLVSRGNMRELEKHLGVSYPTARQRFAELLGRLGFEEQVAGEAVLSATSLVVGEQRDEVLRDLSTGRIGVEEAERLLGG